MTPMMIRLSTPINTVPIMLIRLSTPVNTIHITVIRLYTCLPTHSYWFNHWCLISMTTWHEVMTWEMTLAIVMVMSVMAWHDDMPWREMCSPSMTLAWSVVVMTYVHVGYDHVSITRSSCYDMILHDISCIMTCTYNDTWHTDLTKKHAHNIVRCP